jgi:type IV secretory pathway TrbD component
MLLWIILGLSWIIILFAAVCLFRIAGYADKKMRRIVQRPRRSEDQAA